MPNTKQKLEFIEKTARELPEYRDILALFQRVFAMVNGRESETGITFSPAGNFTSERVEGGFPLLRSEDMSIVPELSFAFMAGVIDIMLEVGKEAEKEIQQLQQAVNNRDMDLQALFGACLQRDRKVLDDEAARLGIQPPLLEYLLEVPFRTAIEFFAESLNVEMFEGWKESYCPVCGSRAGMAELVGEEGKRFLSCCSCSHKWPFKRGKCPYCSSENPDALSYFIAGDGPTRVDVCAACSRYIKTRDSRKGNADVPLEAEDLTTIHLDLLAAKEGYERGK